MTWQYVVAASEAALRAGEVHKARYGQQIEIEHKGTINLVTEVDRQCEAIVLAVLRERFPDHDIVTEETLTRRSGSRFVWFVDPLDGTTNFAHGYPCFAVSIALTIDGETVAGVVHDALHADLFTGERGAGSFRNGRRMHVSAARELIDSLVLTGFPYDIHLDTKVKLRRFTGMMSRARAIRRDGAAALDLCYVAAGQVDAFWEDRLEPWDMLAANLMIEEAGGRVSRYDGSPVRPAPDEIAASNGLLHDKLLAGLRLEE